MTGHVTTACHMSHDRTCTNKLTWQKSEHFSETAKNPLSLEHLNRRLYFMKSAFWGKQTNKVITRTKRNWSSQDTEGGGRFTFSYSAFPPRATQKKFSGSEPSWITTFEYVDCRER